MFSRLCVAASVLLMLLAAPAMSQPSGITSHQGVWQVLELNTDNFNSQVRLRRRDLEFTLRETTGGFQLDWTILNHQRSDPNLPVQSLGRMSVLFQEVGRELWQGRQREARLGAAAPYAWAFILDTTLVVNVLQIHGDGRSELHSYRRTPTADGMDLDYTLVLDGETLDRLTAHLIKISD